MQSYGSLSLFYGGLESLLGPPKMYKGSLRNSMEQEHTGEKDAKSEFTTSNGVTTTAETEWEAVIAPRPQMYPERRGFREQHPEWCRVLKPLEEMINTMETDCNRRLRDDGHTEMIIEELVGGRLYTGPMYAKYNAVLRAKSGDPFLINVCESLCMGNSYTTTIHATNSCVIKLSKLTKAGKVYRGIKDAKLPKSFWVANSMGVRGGIEYGFSSTTTDESQAMHYAGAEDASDHASTVFQMQMGMVDRGADLSWLSQYPHEKEVLLPPLTGLEALETRVSSGMLVIEARLSLNMAAHTLEQVLSRRRKMLMDMRDGIALELRDGLDTKLGPYAVKVLEAAMNFNALHHAPEWFNNDENFAQVMQSTLRMQHELMANVQKLYAHNDKSEISFKGWGEKGLLGSRSTMLIGWVINRSSNAEVFIDLRNCNLTHDDGMVLARALASDGKRSEGAVPNLTSLDVRGNHQLQGEALAALIQAMKDEKPGHPRSVCGVTPLNTRLDVPRLFDQSESLVDTELIVAELESHLYSESVTAGMGGAVSGDVIQLNRRGGAGAMEKGNWIPLLWAAKMNHIQIATQLIKNGTNVNVQETAAAKSNKSTALHIACYKNHDRMARLLLEAGADTSIQDLNGQTAKQTAEKKNYAEVLNVLKEFESLQAGAKPGKDAKADKPEFKRSNAKAGK